jgi:hypothetical protein
VLTAATPSQAVAICVAQFVSAAIVDAESLRGKEWPVVKSLKMVRPSLPIILLDERRTERELVLPEGISDVLSVSSMSELGEKIKQILVRNNFVTTAWNSVWCLFEWTEARKAEGKERAGTQNATIRATSQSGHLSTNKWAHNGRVCMKAKLLHDKDGLRTFAIVFDKGDEVRKQLLEFANTNRFADAHLTAIGACSEVKLGFFDRQQRPTKRSRQRTSWGPFV